MDCSTMAKLRMGREGKVRRRDWVLPMRCMSVRSEGVKPGWLVVISSSSSCAWVVYCGISAAKAVSPLLLGGFTVLIAFSSTGRVMANG